MKPISIERAELLHHFDESQNNTFCVITGKNGDGKSRLLSSFVKEGIKSDRWQAVIAVSTTPFDSFPRTIMNSNSKTIYRYVGVKGYNSNNSAKQLIESATMNLFSDKNKESLVRLDTVLDFLGFDPFFEFIFKIPSGVTFDDDNRTYFISKNENDIELETDLNRFTFSSNRLYSVVRNVHKYFSELADKNGLIKINHDLYENNFSHKGEILPRSILSDVYKIQKTEALSIIDVRLKKKSEQQSISMRNASSGEQCVLLSMIGIASIITDDTLILIDEPEISLHPYWQEKYISLLSDLCSRFEGCTFFIATHSPLVISKLNQKNSYIYDVKKEILTPANQFTNKSADYQLANVFELPGDNNEYLTRILVSFLIKKTTLTKIKEEQLHEVKLAMKLKNSLDEQDSVYKLIKLVEISLGESND